MDYLIKSFTDILKNKGILDKKIDYDFDEIKFKRIKDIKTFFVRKMYKEIPSTLLHNNEFGCMNFSVFAVITKDMVLPIHYQYIYKLYGRFNEDKNKIIENKKVLDSLFEALEGTEKIVAFCLVKRIQEFGKSPTHIIEIYSVPQFGYNKKY